MATRRRQLISGAAAVGLLVLGGVLGNWTTQVIAELVQTPLLKDLTIMFAWVGVMGTSVILAWKVPWSRLIPPTDGTPQLAPPLAPVLTPNQPELTTAEQMALNAATDDRANPAGAAYVASIICNGDYLASHNPYLDFTLTIFNGSPYMLKVGTGISGRLVHNGQLLKDPIEIADTVAAGQIIKHGQTKELVLRQYLLPDVAKGIAVLCGHHDMAQPMMQGRDTWVRGQPINFSFAQISIDAGFEDSDGNEINKFKLRFQSSQTFILDVKARTLHD